MLSRSRLLGLSLVGVAASLLLVVGVALAVLPPGGTFDDDNGNTHEGNIEAIAAEGITLGCNPPANNRYCPSNAVTRGQMAAFLNRAFKFPASNVDYFTDDNGTTFEADINAIAKAGITQGCNPPANDHFCPSGQVNRGQMAAFLNRTFRYPAATTDYFSDDNTSVFEKDINAIAKAGITLGCNPPTNTKYCPSGIVRRDQMASFLARAMDLTPITPPPATVPPPTNPPATKTFGDGVWIVGVDIAPGTYRTDASPGWCYAARLSGFSGELDDVIVNELSYDPLIVTIEATDAGFSSEDCDLWTNDTTPRTTSPTAGFSDGDWSVGDEVAPGLWRNSDSSGWCYWERLSGFSWSSSDIIANGLSYDIQTVRIEAGDRGFGTEDCGTWTYLGP
jgi:hypothetical protein